MNCERRKVDGGWSGVGWCCDEEKKRAAKTKSVVVFSTQDQATRSVVRKRNRNDVVLFAEFLAGLFKYF